MAAGPQGTGDRREINRDGSVLPSIRYGAPQSSLTKDRMKTFLRWGTQLFAMRVDNESSRRDSAVLNSQPRHQYW